MYKGFWLDKLKKPIAIIVQLASCAVQLFLLLKLDYTVPLVQLILQAGFIYLIPAVTLLILRITLGKPAASFTTVPIWVVSAISTFYFVSQSYSPGSSVFIPLVRLTAIYCVFGFLPTLIISSVRDKKEKQEDAEAALK
jgi:hypothetical protein